ncbi:MAG TPA: hypothetical protein VGB66_11930 [Longimicrobium sp.]|jgi:hypothetical protein
MKYANAEDRLNPLPPADADESTLGGYMAIYGRSAAFEGMDGEPYTVGLETEPADGGFAGYLVFIRWAQTGTAIMGHLETGDLVHAATADEARALLEALPLAQARAVLDETIARKRTDDQS